MCVDLFGGAEYGFILQILCGIKTEKFHKNYVGLSTKYYACMTNELNN